MGVNLNKDHATALELVEKRIKHGRVFISAVSAVTFIVNTLPTVPKAHRYDRIAAYLKKLDDTSSKKILPVNLLKYLEQDIFKCPPPPTHAILGLLLLEPMPCFQQEMQKCGPKR